MEAEAELDAETPANAAAPIKNALTLISASHLQNFKLHHAIQTRS
jgi:hypothetical protein